MLFSLNKLLLINICSATYWVFSNEWLCDFCYWNETQLWSCSWKPVIFLHLFLFLCRYFHFHVVLMMIREHISMENFKINTFHCTDLLFFIWLIPVWSNWCFLAPGIWKGKGQATAATFTHTPGYTPAGELTPDHSVSAWSREGYCRVW